VAGLASGWLSEAVRLLLAVLPFWPASVASNGILGHWQAIGAVRLPLDTKAGTGQ
jgi:hypothetical protein